jgi:hypothetical protein
LSSTLAGKTLKIVTNGPTLNYRFTNNTSLSLTEGTGRSDHYQLWALNLQQLVVFSHLLPNTQKGYHVVIDQRTNLTTVFETWFSG